MKRVEAEKIFKRVGGREGVAKRVLQLAKEIVDCDSYKRAIAGAGQMKVLYELCMADSYWSEKAGFGEHLEENNLERADLITNPTPIDSNCCVDWKELQKRKKVPEVIIERPANQE